MRIVVDQLPSGGRQIDLALTEEWVRQAATTALDGAPTEIAGALDIQRASDRGLVTVTGTAAAWREATCDRCGEPCRQGAEVDVSLLYAPAARDDETFAGGEIELAASDLDVGWYDNGALELGDVLGEALALELPPRIRCADEAECDKRTDALLAGGRSGEPGHPALAALRDRLS